MTMTSTAAREILYREAINSTTGRGTVWSIP